MLKKSIFLFCISFLLCFVMASSVSAEEAVYTGADFDAKGFNFPELLYDGSKATYTDSYGAPKLTVKRQDDIGGIYVIFDKVPSEWTIKNGDSSKTLSCGKNGFLHEFVDVSGSFGDGNKKLQLVFAEGTVISEVYVFSKGDIPSWVQRWEPPCEKADLMLIPTHADDEQLFFAGVLPYYAVERGLKVQVVYLVNHFDTHERPHEQLDGLWEVGIRNYPVISEFPDLYAKSENREIAKTNALGAYAGQGYTFEDFVAYIVECIRRFRPLVVVSHDLNGEYGHGAHVVCVDALAEALKNSGDSGKYIESLEKYDPWIPEKVYLHLYSENPITLDLDKPYESLGGKTPFQVSQEGFKHHKTQLWTWFNEWIFGTAADPITKATQIEDYSPCNDGLYYTSVGNDKIGGDFFENVKPYAEREADEETQTAATHTPITSPDTEPFTDSEFHTSSASSDKSDGGSQNNGLNGPVLFAVVMTSVGICIVIMLFAFSSSKTNVRSRRRRRRRYTRR